MITIIDYDMGNVKSIMNMLKRIGVRSVLTRNINDILKAEKLILPGVGSFDTAMAHLEKYGLVDVLQTKVIKDKTPILGICVGLQIMTQGSEEGKLPGLGWFKAKVKKFEFKPTVGEKKLPVPHMGWNQINSTLSHNLLAGLDKTRFYFVHSYHVECGDVSDILATAQYGYEFACAIRKDNICAVQFHPEKSHTFGMRLFQNFAAMKGV